TSQERFPALPDTPTAEEVGFDGFKVVGWYGIVAPHGVPQDRLDLLNAAFNKTVSDPDVKMQLEVVGVIPSTAQLSARETSDYIAREYDRWTAEIKEAGLEPQ
ncbi:MAG: tripartite tricarboxylate transporter substrate binding protein, partial [Candidatus Competibacteraceae bacterium]|nr:tripartite tricarboxylate transporter substrate binding protein [Candidatus Competibacteraceae bacterium]